VDDIPAVAVVDGLTDFDKVFQPVLQRTPFFRLRNPVEVVFDFQPDDEILEGDAVDELHCQVEAVAVVAVQTVERDDRRVVELGVQFGFGNEFPDRRRIAQKIFPQRFDDHFPVERPILGFPDYAEPAFGDLVEKLIAPIDVVEPRPEFRRVDRFHMQMFAGGTAGNLGGGVQILVDRLLPGLVQLALFLFRNDPGRADIRLRFRV